MEIIVPAAGLSTRFPGMKPKYLLFGYNGRMMLESVIERFERSDAFPDQIEHYTVVILKEHDEKYQAKLFVENELRWLRDRLSVLVLDEPTSGPAETVMKALEFRGVENRNFPFMVKDCDSFFNVAEGMYNKSFVAVSDIEDHKVLKKLASKSFVKVNDQDIIVSIAEKKIISNKFCVGGYGFSSAWTYARVYHHLKAHVKSELYVSHVIDRMIMNEEDVFESIPAIDYVDVGTKEDWLEYNDRPVYFCDIDGTIVVAQSRYGKNSYAEKPIVLQANVDALLDKQSRGCQFIFTTSRPTSAVLETQQLLKDLGFKKFQLICGLNNSARVLINDYNDANPYPRASAINIRRDAENLKDFL